MGTISPDELEAFVRTLLETVGAPDDVAGLVASSLVMSDLRGHSSHGVLRVALYNEMIDDGAIDPTAQPTLIRDGRTTAAIDGNRSFGQVNGREATAELVARTSDYGVATVGIRNGAHLGRVGEWAERVTAEGLCFLAFLHTGGGGKSVAPPGTLDERLGTNPVAFGVPTFDSLPFPIVYDIATSQVSNGKIRERAARDESVPDEWIAVPEDEPIDSAADFFDGPAALLPLGGHVTGYKGFGLAIIAELFAGLIGGGPVAGEVDPDWFNNSAMFVAVDPERFVDRATIERRIDVLAEHICSAERSTELSLGISTSGDEYLLPGEPEYRCTQQQRETGIELQRDVARTLVDLASEYEVEERIPAALASIVAGGREP